MSLELHGSTYDEVHKLNPNKTCSTCESCQRRLYSEELDYQPYVCTRTDVGGIYKLGAMAIKNRAACSTKWSPNPQLTLAWHIEQNAKANTIHPDDQYEIFEFLTGKTKLVLSLFPLKLENRNEKLYYIVKNSKFFFCEDGQSEGFIPLLVPTEAVVLSKFTDLSRAIRVVDLFKSKEICSENLVYTTEDALERKFDELVSKTKPKGRSKP